MKRICALSLIVTGTAFASGSLSSDIRISSEALGYDLQYRVYVPDGAESTEDLPVLFFTDGPGYIKQGRAPKILDRLINSARINPVVAVFVDSRDPDNLKVNRRNQEFFCNADYLRFYTEELIPAIEQAPRLPLRIFLSTGSPNDNSTANRKFRRVLNSKGYDMKFVQTEAGHNWDNWRPLIDDALL